MRAFIYPVVAASALLFGCATDEANKPAATAPAAAAAPAPKPSAAESKPVTPVQAAPKTGATGFAALKDPNNILSKRAVYFDYDKFDVKDEFKPLIEEHAKFLRDNSSAKMLIQGNADERGSREYNVGLGQRRSDAVKKMLTLLGARESQIESVSLGEEKPSCSDHTESCWAKNRRDDMLYGGEY
jgi:peptidoglycan-associated lipoprotein